VQVYGLFCVGRKADIAQEKVKIHLCFLCPNRALSKPSLGGNITEIMGIICALIRVCSS